MQNLTKEGNSPPPIDLIEDDLLTDSQVGRLLGVSPASICRYRLKGKAGVRLPWTWRGRSKVTTRAAIDWWQAEVQRAAQGRPLTSKARQLDPTLAAECEAAGI